MQKSKLQLKIQKFWPIIFILALWFVFAHPYFIKGLVPYSSTYQVNFFAPWSHYEQFWGPIKNNAMPDVHTQIYPWKKFTIDTFKNGQMPFWNPYSFAGNPHLANFQSAVLSSFNLLFFVLPFIDAWSILVFLQPLLAGIFTYIFVRAIGVGSVGSVVSSITFMFCGFIVVWMAYGTLAYAILYLPLALFAIEKFYESRKVRYILLFSLTIPLSFFSGHFQISFYFFVAVISYILFKGIATKKLLATGYLLLASALGLILSLPQVLTSITLYQQSVRSELFQLGEAIPFQYLITIVAPDFFGNPVTRNDWFGHYAEWASFVGVLPLLLGIYALLKVKSQKSKVKTVAFFGILGLASFVLAINSQVSNLLVSLKIPVLSTSALSRIIVLFSFAFAVLSGFGFDQLIGDVREVRGIKKFVTVCGVIGVFFVVIWFLLFFGTIYPEEWIIVAKRNLVLPTALFVVGAMTILLSVKKKKFLLLATSFLLLATSFDSLRFAQKWMPFESRGLVYPEVPVISQIKQHMGDGRVFGNLGGEVAVYYGIPILEGYDPLYIGRYGEFIRSAASGEFVEAERSVVKVPRNSKHTDRILDLLGVSLVYQPIADTNQGWAYPVWDKKDRYTLVYKDDKFELYKNNKAQPRASLFYNFEVVKEPSEIIGRFYSDDFDFRKTLLLEEDPGTSLKEGTGSAEILQYSSNNITVHVKTTQEALFFLADNFYPGWKAMVNGEEAQIYRTDYTFRAVRVPQGDSTVEFTYKPTLAL